MSWIMPMSVPPLKLRYGYSLLSTYQDTVPFFIHSSTNHKESNRLYLVFYAYAYYSVIQASIHLNFIDLHLCNMPHFFPCIKASEIAQSRKEFLDENSVYRLAFSAANNTLVEVNPSEPSCYFQPVYPLRAQSCSISLGGPRYIYTYAIHFHASPDNVNCPGYLKYQVSHRGEFVILSGKSVIHTVKGFSLHIKFEQGCLWMGATFIIYRSISSTVDVKLSKDSPHAIIPFTEFSTDIPLQVGNYTLMRINTEFNTKMVGFYRLDIKPTCHLTKPWGDIMIADIMTIKHSMLQVRISQY